MFEAFEDFLLVFDMVDVLALNNVGLFHSLNSVFVLRLALSPADSHVTKSTYTRAHEIRVTHKNNQDERKKAHLNM